MTHHTRWLPLALAGAALLLAFAAQNRLAPPQPQIGEGLALALLAALSLVAARAAAHGGSVGAGGGLTLPHRPTLALRRPRIAWDAEAWRWALTLVASLVAFWLLATLRDGAPRSSYAAPLLAWFMSTALLVVAWAEPLPAPPALRGWLRAHRREIAAVAGLTLVAAGLRLWLLGAAPFTLGGDEASAGLFMRRVAAGEALNPFALGFDYPALSLIAKALPARLLGFSVASLRLGDALFGALAVPMLYLFARRQHGRRTAFVAATLLAAYHFHLHYSRIAENVAIDTFFFTATLTALLAGLRPPPEAGEPRIWPFVLAGVLAGLDQYIYTGSRLLPLLIAAYLGYLWLVEPRRLRGAGAPLALMGLTFLIVAGPILLFALQHPNEYNARLNQVGVFQSGWLARETTIRGQSAPLILWDQFRRALFAFGLFPDRSSTYGPGTPLAGPPMAIFLYLGLALATWRWRQPRFALVALWFWAVLLSGGVLTVNPPSSNRLVALTPAVALLAAIGLHTTVRLLVLALRPAAPHRWRWLLLGVLTLVIVGRDLNFYFRDYLPTNRFGGAEAMAATLLGAEVRAQRQRPTLYLHGAPRLFSGISTLGFLAPGLEATDITEPVNDPTVVRARVAPGRPALFVFLPERFGELTAVSAAFPGGDLREVRSPDGREVMYYSYFVPNPPPR